MTNPLLQVRNLKTQFATEDGIVHAVDDVSFEIMPGEVFAMVGESGCGKTVTALSILGLVPRPAGKVVGGEIIFKGVSLREIDDSVLRGIRGNRIAMIFQDPLTALNPVFKVGDQIAEVFRTHQKTSKKAAWSRSVALLELVGIPRPADRAHDYPHQFSGGMRQRAMIAMAMALNPDLLIADEPTTALDATIQAQILDVLLTLREEFNVAIMLITHDLAIVAGVADRVMVMYAGKVAEMGTCNEIFYRPKHPYTWGLMTSLPRLDEEKRQRLKPIGGLPPSLINLPPGCPFTPRCTYSKQICIDEYPTLRPVGDGSHPDHIASCHFVQRPDWEPPAEVVAARVD